jgi:hypothetical protein
MFCRENEEMVAVATQALRLVLTLFPIVGFQTRVSETIREKTRFPCKFKRLKPNKA